MTHRSNSAVGQDRFELRDECTAGPMRQSAAHGETAAGVAKRKPASTVSGEQSDRQLSSCPPVLAGTQARS